jgi:hypothetical protein
VRKKVEGVVIFTTTQKRIMDICKKQDINQFIREIHPNGDYLVIEHQMPGEPTFDLKVNHPEEYLKRMTK